MKSNIKNQRGAISLFVLLSMMFFLVFMLGAFTIVNRRNVAQVEALAETKRIYANGTSAAEQYDEIFQTTGSSVVPITNLDQLQKVKEAGTGTSKFKYLINGKVYTYAKDTNYVLQNDIILDLEDTIKGKKDLQNILLDSVLYNTSYKVNLNGHSIYYQADDGSVWKLIWYQNIGTSDSKNNFSNTSGDANYCGKAYNPERFSILDEGISAYSNKWVCKDSSVSNFEFMLMYTSGTNQTFDMVTYNRWRQNSNPTKENIDNSTNGATKATGYTINFDGACIKLASTDAVTSSNITYKNYWGGLTKSTSSACYLNGSVSRGEWFYAVGVIGDNFHSTYGIASSDIVGGSSKEGLLFVRYK